MRNGIDHKTHHPDTAHPLSAGDATAGSRTSVLVTARLTAPEDGKDSGHWLFEAPAVDGVAVPPKVGDSWKSVRRLGD